MFVICPISDFQHTLVSRLRCETVHQRVTSATRYLTLSEGAARLGSFRASMAASFALGTAGSLCETFKVLGIGYWVLGLEQSHVGCLQGTHPLAMMFVADFAV